MTGADATSAMRWMALATVTGCALACFPGRDAILERSELDAWSDARRDPGATALSEEEIEPLRSLGSVE